MKHCGGCRWWGENKAGCRWCGFFGLVEVIGEPAWKGLNPKRGPFWANCRGWEQRETTQKRHVSRRTARRVSTRSEWRVSPLRGDAAFRRALADPRCPGVGKTMDRKVKTEHGFVRVVVAITPSGFECEGQKFSSPSPAVEWWGRRHLGWGPTTRCDGWRFLHGRA
jgi:hypothetical protein